MSHYEIAIRSLSELTAGALSHRQILRLDPHQENEVWAQVELSNEPQWYRCGPRGCTGFELTKDSKIPSAKYLAKLIDLGQGQLLGWRPNKRATLRSGSGPDATILKGFRKGRSAAARSRYELAERVARGSRLEIPSVLSWDADRDLIEMSIVPGRPVDLTAARGDEFFRLGHGLRQIQEADAGRELQSHSLQAELQLLAKLAQRVLDLRGKLPDGWDEQSRLLSAHVPSNTKAHLVPAHRDLHDGQILTRDGQMGLLDFDLLCLADPALDVANLTAHLRLRAIQDPEAVSDQTVGELGGALLEGLDRSTEEGFLQSLRFYQATTFLRLSLVYSMRPRWERVVPSLVSLATRCVHEVATA